MNCQSPAGLLFVRECGQPASAACMLCGRALCPAHTVLGSAGPACPNCAAHNPAFPQGDETELAGSRAEFHQRYGQQGYFSEREQAAMRQRGATAATAQKKSASDRFDS